MVPVIPFPSSPWRPKPSSLIIFLATVLIVETNVMQRYSRGRQAGLMQIKMHNALQQVDKKKNKRLTGNFLSRVPNGSFKASLGCSTNLLSKRQLYDSLLLFITLYYFFIWRFERQNSQGFDANWQCNDGKRAVRFQQQQLARSMVLVSGGLCPPASSPLPPQRGSPGWPRWRLGCWRCNKFSLFLVLVKRKKHTFSHRGFFIFLTFHLKWPKIAYLLGPEKTWSKNDLILISEFESCILAGF